MVSYGPYLIRKVYPRARTARAGRGAHYAAAPAAAWPAAARNSTLYTARRSRRPNPRLEGRAGCLGEANREVVHVLHVLGGEHCLFQVGSDGKLPLLRSS